LPSIHRGTFGPYLSTNCTCAIYRIFACRYTHVSLRGSTYGPHTEQDTASRSSSGMSVTCPPQRHSISQDSARLLVVAFKQRRGYDWATFDSSQACSPMRHTPDRRAGSALGRPRTCGCDGLVPIDAGMTGLPRGFGARSGPPQVVGAPSVGFRKVTEDRSVFGLIPLSGRRGIGHWRFRASRESFRFIGE